MGAVKQARKQVLRKPAEFAAVVRARSAGGVHRARHWLALGARLVRREEAPGKGGEPCLRLRLGLTVPRRYAKRAVDRNLVKRVVREATRAARPVIEAKAQRFSQVDVVIRLKAPLPPVADCSRRQLKLQLRQEADALLGFLLRV